MGKLPPFAPPPECAINSASSREGSRLTGPERLRSGRGGSPSRRAFHDPRRPHESHAHEVRVKWRIIGGGRNFGGFASRLPRKRSERVGKRDRCSEEPATGASGEKPRKGDLPREGRPSSAFAWAGSGYSLHTV